ncbi:hypothetical protein JI721_14415 [Alicyclobacillus cycloheptanicus]|uniref:Uncharacterized protein n=1 Tax=Alicyclobacillus cycloheptanicus TaxID=1457 RepID=A0ABT9XMZ2_9BACL|nr:hypothetical protein [Alicyclobacillus cycloheptanicus]MDQ0191071.1 hypothetical protein [Alicyclobacillus cycloheptanicus]WDM00865.1 hypothetical protein JI721_14415 [Alicyclobacillus cycloheptanicus]
MQGPGGAMPGGGVITSQSPPFAVPIRYMLLGIVCFGLFAIDFGIQSSALAQGIPGAPNVVALTHALTLGALLSFVMGAVYQLTTVAFLIPIASVPAARWNFWVYLVGLVGLFVSMSLWWSTGFLVFGFLIVLSIYLYAVVLIVSLMKTAVRGPMFGFVVSAHAYLILAVSIAVLLVLADSGAVSALNNVMGELIATHILFAVGGFFTFLVMGFSFKLLPMFTLSHGFQTWRQKWTMGLAHAALWVVLSGIWTHLQALFWAGAIIGIAAFVSQILDIRGIVRKRMRKKIEPPIRGVVVAAVAGILGLCLLLVRVLWPMGEAGWQGVVMFYLLGVVTLTVMGFAYKIVPFLVWTKRYSKSKSNAGGKPVLISDLIDLNQSWPVLIGFAVGLIALTASAAASWKPGVIGSSVLIAIAILVFCVQILKVMEPAKLGKELQERD